MRILRTAGFAGLALMATASQAAQTVKQQACITPEEMSALVLAVSPQIIGSLVKTCTAALPADAYLRVRGGALVERYAAPAAAAKPAAVAAFSKVSGTAVPAEMFDVAADAILGELAVEKIKPKDCPKIDRILGLVDPLPPANFSGLVAAIIEYATEDEKGGAPIAVCKPN